MLPMLFIFRFLFPLCLLNSCVHAAACEAPNKQNRPVIATWSENWYSLKMQNFYKKAEARIGGEILLTEDERLAVIDEALQQNKEKVKEICSIFTTNVWPYITYVAPDQVNLMQAICALLWEIKVPKESMAYETLKALDYWTKLLFVLMQFDQPMYPGFLRKEIYDPLLKSILSNVRLAAAVKKKYEDYYYPKERTFSLGTSISEPIKQTKPTKKKSTVELINTYMNQILDIQTDALWEDENPLRTFCLQCLQWLYKEGDIDVVTFLGALPCKDRCSLFLKSYWCSRYVYYRAMLKYGDPTWIVNDILDDLKVNLCAIEKQLRNQMPWVISQPFQKILLNPDERVIKFPKSKKKGSRLEEKL